MMIVKNASRLTAPEQLEGRLKAAHLSSRESFIGIIPLCRAKIICLSRAAWRAFYEICLPGSRVRISS